MVDELEILCIGEIKVESWGASISLNLKKKLIGGICLFLWWKIVTLVVSAFRDIYCAKYYGKVGGGSYWEKKIKIMS